MKSFQEYLTEAASAPAELTAIMKKFTDSIQVSEYDLFSSNKSYGFDPVFKKVGGKWTASISLKHGSTYEFVVTGIEDGVEQFVDVMEYVRKSAGIKPSAILKSKRVKQGSGIKYTNEYNGVIDNIHIRVVGEAEITPDEIKSMRFIIVYILATESKTEPAVSEPTVIKQVAMGKGKLKAPKQIPFPSIAPGVIFYIIAGYSMTIPKFYKVVKRAAKSVYVQELEIKYNGNQYGTATPIDRFADSKQIRTVLKGVPNCTDPNTVHCKIEGHNAGVWDGHPINFNFLD